MRTLGLDRLGKTVPTRIGEAACQYKRNFVCAEKLLSAAQGETTNVSTKIVMRPVDGDDPETRNFSGERKCAPGVASAPAGRPFG